ncbi:dynamin family protein [Marivita hallyeonensis]|uniref:Dynamin family protein n=1 Tax=Marivita hallyeonensis TaxID=996342 RepID=A0A1M5RYA1_9RHOB|nr:dynamin family protein [Marivita hallyeonensis]SHH31180.1 Dynamin family protein [Marivita hallyeonensis]
MNIEAKITPAVERKSSVKSSILKAGTKSLGDFADRVATVERAIDDLSGVVGENTARSFERLHRQLDEFEPSVTLLGQVKAGKTALVNAMAGWSDLLPSDVNPWTSVVTSLHLQPGTERPEVAARFKFMTEDEWDRLLAKGGRIGELAGRAGAESELQKIRSQIEEMRSKSRHRLGRKFELLMGQEHEYGYFDKNLLERYICLGDDFADQDDDGDIADLGKFADITRSADLYLNSETFPFRMCLRDTPGVNDTFMMREQITIRAIRESRVCVVVLSAGQALTSVDMGLIRLISNIDTRELIVFVNRIDELTDPAKSIPEIEDSIRETLRKHHGPDNVEILFGSAYWANKVLSGELESLGDSSSKALFKWAEVKLQPDAPTQSATEMIWELSGLPALSDAISRRVVEKVGEEFVQKTASSAITLATAQQAANTVRIEGSEDAPQIDASEIKQEFERIVQDSINVLNVELDTVIRDFNERADRARENFVARASHSLIDHLERYGPEAVWEYQPEGLRILLRSAYKVMGSRVQSTAKARYEAAVSEIAQLLYKGFGSAVEGIQIGVPSTPDIPAPVALGQTIALDFNDSWWVSWWRLMRGYKAFAKRFQELITAETEDFMYQLKAVQTDAIKLESLRVLQEFFDEQRDILLELLAHPDNSQHVHAIFGDEAEDARQKTIENALKVLQPIAA